MFLRIAGRATAALLLAAAHSGAQAPSCASGAEAAAQRVVARLPASLSDQDALRQGKLTLDSLEIVAGQPVAQRDWQGWFGTTRVGQAQLLCIAGDSARAAYVGAIQRSVSSEKKKIWLAVGGALAAVGGSIATSDNEELSASMYVAAAFLGATAFFLHASSIGKRDDLYTPRSRGERVVGAYNRALDSAVAARSARRGGSFEP